MLKESIYKNDQGQELGRIKLNKSKRYDCVASGKKKSFPVYREAENFVLGESGEYHSMEFSVSRR
jgi:hypothetical protein